ncbi:MAG: hypothetical protein Q9169_004203 [Polycauliona sp. 2 TL-2023]
MERLQADSNATIQELIQWIGSTKERGMRCATGENGVYDWEVPYVSRTALKDYLGQHHVMDDLLQALYNGDGPALEAVDAGHIKNKYSMVFGLLIAIGHGRFINYFVDHGIDDQRLPLQDQSKFPTAPSDPQFFTRFYQKQWEFCVPDLDADISRTYDRREWILPIRQLKHLGHGGSAHAYQIEVHRCYNKLDRAPNSLPLGGSHDSGDTCPNTFVLKSYRKTVDAEKCYEKEWKALKRVHSPTPSRHVVRFFGRFTLGGVHNILLEYVDLGTLEDYLRMTPPPCTAKDIIDFWRSTLSVTEGLLRIHNSMHSTLPVTDSPSLFQGWHHDIKPTNLFIRSHKGASAYNFECKLGDLGLSHFKPSQKSQRTSFGKDAYGTRTYGAPDCFRPDNAMAREPLAVEQSIDVWSLGCVLSETATWVAGHWDYVEEYRNQRRIEIKKMGNFRENDDFFHNGGDHLLETVGTCHELLVGQVRTCDYVTKEVIKMIDNGMLQPSKLNARCNAKDLVKLADTIIKGAKKNLEQTAGCFTLAGSASQDVSLRPRIEEVLIPPKPAVLNFDPPAQPQFTRRLPSVRDGSWPSEYQLSTIQRTVSATQGIGNDAQRSLRHIDRAETPPHQSSAPLDTQDVSSRPERSRGSVAFRRRPESYSSHRLLNDVRPPLSDEPSSMQADVFTAQTNDSNITGQDSWSFPTVNIRQRHWTIQEALDWKRVKKDPKNREPVDLPYEYRTELEGLNKRDHAFLIDNSYSMLEYWSMAQDLLEVIGYIVKNKDPDGVDLIFTCPFKKYSKIKTTSELIERFHRHQPTSYSGPSDMSARFTDALSDYQNDLANRHERKSFSSFMRSTKVRKIRKLSLYVFTDAVWQPICDVSPVIKSLVSVLEKQNLPKQQIGVQFVRFGDNPEGKIRLERLDRMKVNGEVSMLRDIVDTEPVTGNIGKILFGAVNDWFDDDEPSNGMPLGSPSTPTRSIGHRLSANASTSPRT